MTVFSSFWSRFVSQARALSSSKAVAGAFWVVSGSVGSQVIRLIGNLILTRLLFPEAFGVMALAFAVIIGLSQLSDIGLREGVVNSPRISEPIFMRTAWTLQILRSVFLGLLACALAFPVAAAYNEPILGPVICLIGLSVLINGFKTIGLFVYDKKIDLKRQIVSDLIVQVFGLLITIGWTIVHPTIWALVAGAIASSVLEVVLSYLIFKEHNSRLCWEKPAVKELFNFGKWIVISSAISYLILQGDKLLMGFWLDMGNLGLYSIAATWSAIVALVSYNLATRVLHPYFLAVLDKNSDFSQIRKVRNRLNGAYAAVCVVLALFGNYLVVFLYDERYHEAGWMLQILAIGQIGRAFTGTLRPFLTACLDSYSQMKTSAISAVIIISFILIGGWLGEEEGVIIAYSLSGIAMHPVMVLFARKHGYRCMKSDLGLIFMSIAIVFLGWWFIEPAFVSNLISG